MKFMGKVTIILSFLLYFSLLLIWKLGLKGKQVEVFVQETPVETNSYHLACPYSGADYLSEKTQVEQKVKAQALIVSHHLLAKDLINEAMENTTQDYKTVILVGPNHFNSGPDDLQTTDYDWKTKFGNLRANQLLINKLLQNNYADLNPDNFNTEHSICGLVSFIRKQFPQANLVPLILKSSTAKEKAQNLGQLLAQNCADCLLLISLDFSHDASEAQAEINDQISLEVLSNLYQERIDQVTCDSLPALQVLFSYLKEKAVLDGQLINRSNSNLISNQNLTAVTSYITMIF
jgi:AmmeMemoRadiSam system protein B